MLRVGRACRTRQSLIQTGQTTTHCSWPVLPAPSGELQPDKLPYQGDAVCAQGLRAERHSLLTLRWPTSVICSALEAHNALAAQMNQVAA